MSLSPVPAHLPRQFIQAIPVKNSLTHPSRTLPELCASRGQQLYWGCRQDEMGKPSTKHWGKLRMQRTNPLSGGSAAAAAAASPLPSQHASSTLEKELALIPQAGTPGQWVWLVRELRDPAGEEFTAGESCPPSTPLQGGTTSSLQEETRLVLPLQNQDLCLQVQRDHFVIFTKHHHPSWP